MSSFGPISGDPISSLPSGGGGGGGTTPGMSVTGGTFDYDASPHGGSGFAYGNGGIGDVLSPACAITYIGTGSTVYGPSVTAPTAAGTYSVLSSFPGNGTYDAASASAALTINRIAASVTVTGGIFPYNGSPHPATGTVTGLGAVPLSPGLTYSYVGVSGTTYGPSATPPVVSGMYLATGSFAGNTNYLPGSDSDTIEIDIFIFDSSYSLDVIGPGRTPRALLDYIGGCGPPPHAQLLYLKPGTGAIRLSEEDSYVTEHGTPLGYNANYYLEDFFVTRDLRFATSYSVRNPIAGTYQLKRIDSKSLAIPRPNFIPQVGRQDITWSQGEPWRNPPTTVVTDSWELRLDVTADCDAIEIQCRNEPPVGIHPTYPEQNQEYAPVGGLHATDGHTFNVLVTHGENMMAPAYFRARTRTVKGDRTCYSGWRYLNAPVMLTEAAVGTGTVTPVNCGRDVFVHPPLGPIGPPRPDDLVTPPPPHVGWLHSQYSRPGNCCNTEPCQSGASAPLHSFFEGGWQPFPPLWRHDWSWIVVSGLWIVFTDENGDSFDFIQTGKIITSGQEGTGGPQTFDPNQSPGQFP